jgi:hypothetical protein
MFVAALLIFGQLNKAPLSSGSAELFRWIDSLGYQADLHKPFVRINYIEDAMPHRRITLCYGFLLADRPNSFDVLVPSLSVRTYTKSGGITPATYSPADFRTFVDGYLGSQGKNDPEYWFIIGAVNPWVGRGVDFGLAWICRQQRLMTESDNLLELGKKILFRASYSGRERIQLPKDAIADGVYSDLILGFEDLRLSRTDLYRSFKAFASKFHGTEAGKGARTVCRLLQEMVKEDREHERLTKIRAANLSPQQHVSELLWQLRDCNDDYVGQYSSTLVQLAKIGYPAVPQLLDALHNDRFIRKLFRLGSGSAPEFTEGSILRTNYFALMVLEEIAHRRFKFNFWTKNAEVEKSARDWWSFITSNGEEVSLVESVRRGDANSGQQASRLVEVFPQVALESIKIGVENAQDPEARAGLIRALKNFLTPNSVAFARYIAATDKDFKPRFAAAQVLSYAKPELAISIAEKEWERAAVSPSGEEYTDLIPFLVGSKSPDAVRWMTARLRSLRTEYRTSMLMDYSFGFTGLSSIFAQSPPVPQNSVSTPWNELRTAVEDLLAYELEDREISLGGIGTGDVSLREPEMSQIALYALAKCFPEKYQFAQPKSPIDWNRLRVINLNVYRHSRGLAPDPVPSSS